MNANDLRFGVELEFFTTSEVWNAMIPAWRIDTDGSLRAKDAMTDLIDKELKFAEPYNFDQSICALRQLVESKLPIQIGLVCGMHIHVSNTLNKEVNFIGLRDECHEMMLRDTHKVRREYCNDKDMFCKYQACRAPDGIRIGGGYGGIWIADHVEFRLFNSTKRLRCMIRNLTIARDLYIKYII